MKKSLVLLGLTLALAASAGVSLADDHRWEDDRDHERARDARARGEVRPLAEILAGLASRVEGKVIEVELDEDDDRLVYELTLVAPNGRVREVVVEAATGRVLEIEDEDD